MNKVHLSHHGIKGQRWGIRRFQNEDGTLTPAGEKRYGTVENMERIRGRNKRIAIGVGIGVGTTAAALGAAYLLNRNRKLKNQILELQNKDAAKFKKMQEAQRAAVKARQLKKAADIAAGIVQPKNFKIPPGAKVTVEALTKTDKLKTVNLLDVAGGQVVLKSVAKKLAGG